MQTGLVLELLVLLAVANGTPVVVKRIFGDRLAYPVDGGVVLSDGYPLLGQSKTVRGIVLAVLCTALAGALLTVGWKIGALVGAVAMAGDLFSSFVKRRRGLAASSKAVGLDQIPESLFPLLAAWPLLPLTWVDIVVTTLLFLVAGVVGSRLLFMLKVRDEPY